MAATITPRSAPKVNVLGVLAIVTLEASLLLASVFWRLEHPPTYILSFNPSMNLVLYAVLSLPFALGTIAIGGGAWWLTHRRTGPLDSQRQL
jgi:hypothetical protein